MFFLFTSKGVNSLSITKTNRVMLYTDITAFIFEVMRNL